MGADASPPYTGVASKPLVVLVSKECDMKIFVGHGAYSGANHLRVHGTTHGAVMDLIRRGVDRTVARAKVTAAISRPYGWEVVRCRSEVVEINRRDDL